MRGVTGSHRRNAADMGLEDTHQLVLNLTGPHLVNQHGMKWRQKQNGVDQDGAESAVKETGEAKESGNKTIEGPLAKTTSGKTGGPDSRTRGIVIQMLDIMDTAQEISCRTTHQWKMQSKRSK